MSVTLTLTVLRCPETSVPETRVVTGGEFSIGRGPENDWVLPDRDRHLSKRHCVLAFRGGGWQVAGSSSNGTFLVPARAAGGAAGRPLEELGPRPVADGDRLVLGPYEIELRLGAAAARERGAAASPGNAGFGQGPFGAAPAVDPFGSASAGDPFGRDPLASPPSRDDDPFGADPLGGPPSRSRAAVPSAGDPFGDDPFAPRQAAAPAQRGLGGSSEAGGFGAQSWEAGASALGSAADPFAPPPSPLRERHDAGMDAPRVDHSPAVTDAFRPQAPGGQAVLPDDWDLDLGAPAPSPLTPPPMAPPPMAPPVRTAPPSPVVVPPKPPPPMPAPPTVRAEAEEPDAFMAPPVAAPSAPAAPVAAAPSGGEAALLAAFLRGAGLDGVTLEDPVERMERLGAAFRAMVAGVRQALIARSSIKGEFRIGQTMVRTRGNNPLKFSADDDDALAALLGTGRRSDMAAAEAVGDALADMRHHELATMAAMQGAVRALLARFAPAGLREAEAGGLRLPGAGKARAWDAFEALHAQVTQGLSDDFDSVFGKSFARAYEQAMQDLSAREGRR